MLVTTPLDAHGNVTEPPETHNICLYDYTHGQNMLGNGGYL